MSLARSSTGRCTAASSSKKSSATTSTSDAPTASSSSSSAASPSKPPVASAPVCSPRASNPVCASTTSTPPSNSTSSSVARSGPKQPSTIPTTSESAASSAIYRACGPSAGTSTTSRFDPPSASRPELRNRRRQTVERRNVLPSVDERRARPSLRWGDPRTTALLSGYAPSASAPSGFTNAALCASVGALLDPGPPGYTQAR